MYSIKLIIAFAILFMSCNLKSKEYKAIYEKYRTFYYRTNKECFHDSSMKYNDLYKKSMGWGSVDLNTVDTIKINEPTPVCD